jgi:integrase
MAWLEQHPTSQRFKICFRWQGLQFKKTIKTTVRGEAEAIMMRLEENIGLVERGRLQIPEDADIAMFLLSDGKLPMAQMIASPAKVVMLGELRDRYIAANSGGALEANSLATLKMHLNHVVKTLGPNFAIQNLTLEHLQRHVDRRLKKIYRGRTLSPVTVRKEIVNFRACWNWGVLTDQIKGTFPNRGLRYPKTSEKPPFQTWQEIERQIARGGLNSREQVDLWDCLFLTLPEVDEFLAFVKENANQPFIYPMVVFAAHTGARRSELLRVRVDDVDLECRTILLQERKRVRGVRSTRRVPLSPLLADVLQEWLKIHPGGQFLFCQQLDVIRSKSKRSAPTPVTRDEAHDHFQRTLASSKWQVLRGWHVFRHSFCSNCAAQGVDQRLIDAWVGHTTEEMRRRYRHLLPNQERQVIQSVFGNAGRQQSSAICKTGS